MAKSKDIYVGIISLDLPELNYPYFTILKDTKGYKAVNATNNGYFTVLDGYQDLETLYSDLIVKETQGAKE